MKVLIVDDNISALTVIFSQMIDDPSCECFYFSDSRKALVSAHQRKVDGALLDIDMPELDGIALGKELVSLNDSVRLVFITALDVKEEELRGIFGKNYLGLCHKPYDTMLLKRFLVRINEGQGTNGKIEIRTFNGFDVFIDGIPMTFSSSKSKELLAVLIDANGQTRTNGEIISYLWADSEIESGRRLFRDAVFKLKLALSVAGLEDLVDFKRGELRIVKKEGISCDYWDMINGGSISSYSGRYMLLKYEWTEATVFMLNSLANI